MVAAVSLNRRKTWGSEIEGGIQSELRLYTFLLFLHPPMGGETSSDRHRQTDRHRVSTDSSKHM